MRTKFVPFILLSCLLIGKSAKASETEPNNTWNTANTLALNGSNTGVINPAGDIDWWKVTTSGDGALTVSLTATGGKYTYFDLYDTLGNIALHTGTYTNSTSSYTVDGLAKGTYYIKIYCYYGTDTGSYVISNTLAVPAQANDVEPNNTKAQATTLPLNGSKTGHVGYYYNNYRDTSDWYKVTTNADGLLRLTLTPANGQYVYVTLYDNNGTTVLNSNYSNTTFSQSTDGLAAGTYYLKIYCYYNSGFAPYTLSDSLFTYNANDVEPNKYFKQASLLISNDSATGHVGFYYNGVRDTIDTWKINYTGSGNLQVKLGLLPHASDGSYNYTYLQMYKDTTQAPIYSQYFIGSSPLIANLSSLTRGYYYIRIFEYYSSNFTAYKLSDSYTETPPKVTVAAADTATDCSTTNSITYKFATITGPYSVQLYRFGATYGVVKTTSAKSFTFSGLPDGSYFATASVTGASISGKSKVISLMSTPTGTNTSNITSGGAKTNWSVLSCAKYYSVQYRASSSSTWITKKTAGNVGSLVISGLTPGTAYVWQVAAVDSANKILAASAYTDTLQFTTLATGMFANAESEDIIGGMATDVTGRVSVYPNPASSVLHIQLGNSNMKNAGNVLLSLRDMNGRIVWSSQNTGAATISADVSSLSNGIYMLQIVNADKTISMQKVIISK